VTQTNSTILITPLLVQHTWHYVLYQLSIG